MEEEWQARLVLGSQDGGNMLWIKENARFAAEPEPLTVEDEAIVLNNLGNGLLENAKLPSEAVVAFQRAVQLAPTERRRRNLARAMLMSGQVEQGRAIFMELLASEQPLNAILCFARALFAAQPPQLAEALAYFERLPGSDAWQQFPGCDGMTVAETVSFLRAQGVRPCQGSFSKRAPKAHARGVGRNSS